MIQHEAKWLIMNIIYFDYIAGFGINASVSGEWDFYRSFDELVDECTGFYGDDFLLVSIVLHSGSFVGYRESLTCN